MSKLILIVAMAVFDIAFSKKDLEFDRWAKPLKELGYEWESVPVVTKDNYELTLFNIFGKDTKLIVDKQPVLIVHGLYTDAAWWIEMQRQTDVRPDYREYGDITPWMLQLADKGYDVWMANSRGTEYSQGHTDFDSATSDRYWDFTWADIGKYDVPAMIEEIKIITGKE